MAVALDDPRIAAGMAAQFAMRRARLAAGESPIGWKVGFGTPAALEKFRIEAPLIGFMTDLSPAEPSTMISIAGWVRPVAEPEIAIHIGSDLAGGGDLDEARGAIAAIGPAIELADLDVPPDDVEAILSGNIYHKRVILGPADSSRAGADLSGLSARIVRNGEEVAATSELEANTGALVPIVRHVADVLAGLGEGLKAGDVLIAGSLVPPLFLDGDDHDLAYSLDPIGGVSVRFG